MTVNSSSNVHKVASKTEMELEELHNIIQSQTALIEELRSRLGIVLCDSDKADCGKENLPVDPNQNSPLVDKLKELKALATHNVTETGSIIDSLEI